MKKIPVNNIVQKIHEEKNLPIEEIKQKINSKVSELSGLVSEEGAAHILANELGVKIFQDNEPKKQKIKIKDILPNMRNLVITGKIMTIFNLVTFERDSNPGKVRSVILGDETGKLRVTFWHKATEIFMKDEVQSGTIIKISNVSSKTNNGRVELSVNNPEDVEINPEGVAIEVPIVDEKEVGCTKIAESKEGFACLIGTIVQIFKPNFYERCPECGKKVNDKKCILHGEVTPKSACILNLIIDDGTDTLRCVLFNDLAEIFVGSSVEELQKNLDEKLEIIKKNLLGTIVKLTGNIRYSSFLTANELVVNKIKKMEEIDILNEISNS